MAYSAEAPAFVLLWNLTDKSEAILSACNLF